MQKPVRTPESVSISVASTQSNLRTYTYIKEDNTWYIDLPEYVEQGGSRNDLQMMAGANELLGLLARGNKQVTLTMDTVPFEGAEVLEVTELCNWPIGGAYYSMRTCNGKEINMQIWLCDIILFLFGDMPQQIYVRTETTAFTSSNDNIAS